MEISKTVRIRGNHVIAYDSTIGSHVICPNGEVVFRDDRILYAGTKYIGSVDEEIDARSHLVIPGFVNAHALMDIGIHLLLWDRERDEGYRPRKYVESSDPIFTPEQTRKGAEAMMTMMVRSGVTTFCGVNAMVFKRWDDELWEPELYADVARNLGLRAYLSHHFRASVPIVDDPEPELINEKRGFVGLERNIEFVRRCQRGDFGSSINGLLFPYTQDTVTPELLKATRQAANDLGVGIRMHCAQSLKELNNTLTRFGRTPVEHLADLGILGSDVLLTHCMYGRGYKGTQALSDDELKILAETETNVGHTPWIYLFGGRLLRSFGRYKRAGINLCLGTDTYPGDMIQEMRVASLLGKVAEHSPTAVTAADVFNAATLGGALWLGRDDLGRLAPGAKADFAIIRENSATFAPTLDPIRSLVYYASGRDVEAVYVDGKPIMQDGVIPGINEADVSIQMELLLNDVVNVLESWDSKKRTAEERFPPSFPVHS